MSGEYVQHRDFGHLRRERFPGATVDLVTDQWMAKISKVNSYLMGSPRARPQSEKGCRNTRIEGFFNPPVCDCRP